MLARLSLKNKLLLSFSFVSCVLLIVGAVNYYSLNRVVVDYKHIAEINLPNSINASEMFRHVMVMKQSASMAGMPGVSETDRERLYKEYTTAQKEFDDVVKTYLAVPFQPGEEAVYGAFDKSFKSFKTVSDSLIEESKKVGFDHAKYTSTVLNDLESTADQLTIDYQALSDFHNKKEAVTWVKRAEESSSQGVVWSFSLIIAGVVAALSFGWVLSHGLSKVLTNIAKSLSAESDSVADVAGKISSASNSLSSSTTEQAAALQETVASIEEVSAMVQKNADNSKKSQTQSASCDAAVVKGKETVDQVITAISEISSSNTDIMNQIEDSNKQLADIVNVIKEIAVKTTVINDIVFQTKLLSFNASVEAARAGEHGKGFAVVAQEVGNLAEMSGNAAKEITSMLEGSVHKVEGIVNETKTKVEGLIQIGKNKVEIGTETAHRCGEMLDEIVTLVREVNMMVGEISTASQEQSQGVSEINKAMTQMDQVTQMNASSAQETASSASILSGQAHNLKMMVEELSHTVHGIHGMPKEKKVKPAAPAKSVVPSKLTNVISFQEKKVAKAAAPAPVKQQVAPRKKAEEKKVVVKEKKVVGVQPMKMASSGDVMPSADDPRFEDI